MELTPETTEHTEERYSQHARETVALLEERIEAIYRQVQQQPYWPVLFAPDTPVSLLRAIMRELFLQVYSYQRHTTEAGFLMIGRLPKDENKLIKSTILHKTEEAEHGEWALRDYIALGGDENHARTVAPDPATFAVAAVWWRMALVEEPLGYFGAEYLFEYLTMKVTQPLTALFAKREMSEEGLGFVIEHATEDEKHARLFRHLIADCVTRYPESADAMVRCFDYFNQVYPLPVWEAAYQRALQSESNEGTA